jgi:hypothetical protein
MQNHLSLQKFLKPSGQVILTNISLTGSDIREITVQYKYPNVPIRFTSLVYSIAPEHRRLL